MTAAMPAADDNIPALPLLVAMADIDDFRSQVKARQIGARLLLPLSDGDDNLIRRRRLRI